MRKWIVVGLMGLSVAGSGCELIGQKVSESLAVTQLRYSLDSVALQRADVPLVTANPSADLMITLKADNPNAVSAALDSLTFDLLMDGTKVGSGALAQKLAVPAGGTQTVSVLVTIPYTGLPQAALTTLLARRAAVTLRGTSAISTPLGNLPVPLELTQTVTF